jgi:hypothetical protein
MRYAAAMLLFQSRFHDAIVRGDLTLTFRLWDKPHVRAGGRYRCHPIGVLEVDRVDRVPLADVTAADARRAGFASEAELVGFLASLRGGKAPAEAWRVEFHHGGDGDRVAIALEDRLSADDVAEIEKRLARMDAKGPWTATTLALIEKHPRVAASRLAKTLGRETAPFKADVVKLKKLGLTQSFEVGYEVSPRGRAFLAARGGAAPRAPRRRARS